MSELQSRIRHIKNRIYDLDSDCSEFGNGCDFLSDFSDFSSLPSIHLEKIEIPEDSTSFEDEISEIKENTVKKLKNSNLVTNENSDIITIPPPPINYAPVCGKPIKAKNILSPDLSKYKNATIYILKGRNFPKMKSGVHSTYVTFQFHPSLDIIASPVCYNHSREADYHSGYTIDISNVNIEDAFPVLEVYDVISQKHGNLIGFTVIELQHCQQTDDYITVLKDQWIDVFVPHSRKKSGSILVSLFLHNGKINYAPKASRSAVSFTIPSNDKCDTENNSSEQQINNENNIKSEENLENSLNSSMIPTKENESNNQIDKGTQKSQNQMINTVIADGKPIQQSNVTTNNSNDRYENKNIPKLKSDFNFDIDDPDLLRLLTLDVTHKYSWSSTRNLKRHIRYLDENDIDLTCDLRKFEAETQTDNSVKQKTTQTKSPYAESSQNTIDSSASEEFKPRKLVPTNYEAPIEIDSSDAIPVNLFHSSDVFVQYSDYGFYSRKNHK